MPLAPLSGCVWQKMYKLSFLHWYRSNIFYSVQYQLECLCPHYRSGSCCAESLPVKQILFSGILGPFDCLFFLLTIIHKVIDILNLNKQLLLREKMKISCGATFSRSAGYYGRSKRLSAYETNMFAGYNRHNLLLDVHLWTFVPQRSSPLLRSWAGLQSGNFEKKIMINFLHIVFIFRGDQTSDFLTSCTGFSSHRLTSSRYQQKSSQLSMTVRWSFLWSHWPWN